MDNCVCRSPVGTVYRFTYQRGLCVARLATMGNAKASNAERAMGTGSRFSFYILERRNEPFLNEKLDAMGLFDLLQFSLSSLFYGVIATAAIMAILFFVLKMLSEGIVRSIPFYITGIILFIILSSNLTLLIGARQVQSTTESMELYLRQMTEGYQGIVSTNDSQRIFDSLVDEYPLLGDYLQLADFGGNDISELPTLMSQVIRDEMSSFIWGRVWWIIGSIVVACVIAVCFEKRSVKRPREHARRHISSEVHHRRRYNY